MAFGATVCVGAGRGGPAPAVTIPLCKKAPTTDGKLDDWDWSAGSPIGAPDQPGHAKIAITETADGYHVEASFHHRGLIPDFIWPGRIMQGDPGIIVADKTGRRVARIYRFNKAAGIVNDVPTEASLVPSAWGEIEVDRPAR